MPNPTPPKGCSFSWSTRYDITLKYLDGLQERMRFLLAHPIYSKRGILWRFPNYIQMVKILPYTSVEKISPQHESGVIYAAINFRDNEFSKNLWQQFSEKLLMALTHSACPSPNPEEKRNFYIWGSSTSDIRVFHNRMYSIIQVSIPTIPLKRLTVRWMEAEVQNHKLSGSQLHDWEHKVVMYVVDPDLAIRLKKVWPDIRATGSMKGGESLRTWC